MNNRNYLLLVSVLAAACCGCSQTSVVSKYYRGKDVHAKQFAILPYTITIKNEEDVVKFLGAGDPDVVYGSFFEYTLARTLRDHSRIDSIIFLKKRPVGPLADRRLRIKKDFIITMSLPKDGETLLIDSVKPDFLLFIGKFSVSRKMIVSYVPGKERDPLRPGEPPRMRTESTKGPVCQVMDFAIWDNVNGWIASYGQVNSDVEGDKYSNVITRKAWTNSIREAARDLLKNSPFYSENEKSE